LGSFLKITKVAQIFGRIFLYGKRNVSILTKSGLGNILGYSSQTHLTTLPMAHNDSTIIEID
jgi:hypothetical protein